jgi:rhodanese-related sulfurtransferase
MLRDAGICALAALLSLGIGLAVHQHHAPALTATSSLAPLALTEFRAAIDGGKTLIIDARDDVLYARGHVPHALSLPVRRFDARYAQLRSQLEADRTRSIALYCSSSYCGASAEVKARLQALGFTNVAIFPGGWSAWKTASYPEEKSDATAVVLAPWKNPS